MVGRTDGRTDRVKLGIHLQKKKTRYLFKSGLFLWWDGRTDRVKLSIHLQKKNQIFVQKWAYWVSFYYDFYNICSYLNLQRNSSLSVRVTINLF